MSSAVLIEEWPSNTRKRRNHRAPEFQLVSNEFKSHRYRHRKTPESQRFPGFFLVPRIVGGPIPGTAGHRRSHRMSSRLSERPRRVRLVATGDGCLQSPAGYSVSSALVLVEELRIAV